VVIKIADSDNVGIVPGRAGLPEGAVLKDGTRITRHISMGQKVALKPINEGEEIIRYGQPIGRAIRSVKQGDWVKNSDISMPGPPDLHRISLPEVSRVAEHAPLEGYTFQGYRNRDGTVGHKK